MNLIRNPRTTSKSKVAANKTEEKLDREKDPRIKDNKENSQKSESKTDFFFFLNIRIIIFKISINCTEKYFVNKLSKSFFQLYEIISKLYVPQLLQSCTVVHSRICSLLIKCICR